MTLSAISAAKFGYVIVRSGIDGDPQSGNGFTRTIEALHVLRQGKDFMLVRQTKRIYNRADW
jgi:hypothetical protein